MRRSKEKALETREGILDAAEQVFFERGVGRTTLELVADAAGVTRGAIYWHFQNKVDLLNAVVERVRMPMESTLYDVVETKGTVESLEDLCIRSLAQIQDDERLRRVYTVLLLKCEASEDTATLTEREEVARDQVTGALTRFFERLQMAGQMTITEEPSILAVALYAYMQGLFTDYLRTPQRYSMPKDASRLVRHFFRPLDNGSCLNDRHEHFRCLK